MNNISYINFTGKYNLDKDIKSYRKAFDRTFPNLKSPSRNNLFCSESEKLENAAEFKELSNRLSFVRKYIKTLYPEGGIAEYFRGLIGIVKAFGVANCDEYAEIVKTILRMNGIKKVDIFELYAHDKSNKLPPRKLDHMITAIGVSNKKNQKQSGKLFIPSSYTKIIDFWLDGVVRNYKQASQCYKILGLKDSETLLLKPVKSYEPNKAAYESILKEFPKLKINKK